MTFNRTIYLIIISFLLSACSQSILTEAPIVPTNQDSLTPAQRWQQHQRQLQQLNNWQLQAKLAVITTESRNSANLFWQQNSATDYRVNLTGPFGVHLMTVKFAQGISTLILDDDQKYQHPSTQTLINSFSPIPIPVNELRYWILGEPLSDDYQLDEFGRVTQANHASGWQIKYQNYQRQSGVWLPQKINIQKDDIRIKIATREWKLHES